MIDGAGGERHLHPLAMVGSSLKSLPSAIAGMIGTFTVLMRQEPALAFSGAALIFSLVVGGAVLNWWRFTYQVAEREIVIQKGIFSRQRRVIPFDRVRDIAIEQPLIARLAGTARVRIETGGAKADEGSLDMIEMAEAHRLRDFIRASNMAAAPATETLEEAAPEERVVFAMETSRVLGSGLLNFSLIFVAVAFAALQYLDDLNLVDWEDWLRSEQAKEIVGAAGVRGWLLLALLLVLLGIVSGVVRTTLRDFNFRLTAGPAGLRRRRGLLTLSEVLIPARRTEAARIEVGWLSGLLGWQSLAFQTLGADRAQGGVQVAAPFARSAEVEAILREAEVPLPPDKPLIRPPLRALVRRTGPWLLLTLIIGVASLVWPEAAWGVPLPLIIAAGGFMHWRRDGHLVGDEALYVGGGILRRQLWILPYDKLQTLSTASTPLQRALGLANVEPDLAGAPMFGAPDIEDLPARDAEQLAQRLLASFYTARAELRRKAGRSH